MSSSLDAYRSRHLAILESGYLCSRPRHLKRSREKWERDRRGASQRLRREDVETRGDAIDDTRMTRRVDAGVKVDIARRARIAGGGITRTRYTAFA